MRDGVKCNIVSLRISNEEKQALEQISRMTLKTVSEIMREAMEMVTAGWTGFAPQHAYRTRNVKLRGNAQLH